MHSEQNLKNVYPALYNGKIYDVIQFGNITAMYDFLNSFHGINWQYFTETKGYFADWYYCKQNTDEGRENDNTFLHEIKQSTITNF